MDFPLIIAHRASIATLTPAKAWLASTSLGTSLSQASGNEHAGQIRTIKLSREKKRHDKHSSPLKMLGSRKASYLWNFSILQINKAG